MFVFYNEKDIEPMQAEANSFFCFSILIAEFRDLYIRNMDGHVTGKGRERKKERINLLIKDCEGD